MGYITCKAFRLIFIFSFFVKVTYGQSFPTVRNNVMYPSPTTQEFDKHIKYDVSLYNGLTAVNIPLYEIKLKGMTIPINLSYHGSGIKFKQQSGEVGVGWILNPKYHISKTIYGKEDMSFASGDYSAVASPMMDPYSGFNTMTLRDRYLSGFFKSDSAFPPNNLDFEGEFDIYNFSLKDENGTFILTDRIDNKLEFLDNPGLKVNHLPINQSPYFDVRDKSGVKYKLGGNSINSTALESTGGAMSPTGFTWLVSEILTPFQELIKFDYISKSIAIDQTHIKNAVLKAGKGESGLFSSVTYSSPAYNYASSASLLNEINCDFEDIYFFHDQNGFLLRKIEVRDKQNTLTRRINFEYETIDFYTFLKKVSIHPSDGSAPQVYSFDYYPSAPVNLMTFDDWGYPLGEVVGWGGSGHPYVLPTVLGDIVNKYYTDNRPTSELLGEFIFQNKTSIEPPIDGSLKKITYPSGGYTEYEYELNKVDGENRGRGLRIKNITSNDLVNGSTLIKEYKYGINENGYADANLYIEPSDFVNEGFFSFEYISFNDFERGMAPYSSYSNMPSNEAINDGESKLFYTEVNEYIKDKNGNFLGKNQYRYSVPFVWRMKYNRLTTNASYPDLPLSVMGMYGYPTINHLSARTYFPRFIKNVVPWAKPYLTSSKVYGFINNQFKILEADTLIYEERMRNNFVGLKVQPFLMEGVSYTEPLPNQSWYYGSVSSLFDYANYDVSSGSILLKTKKRTEYLDQKVVSTNFTYTYNDVDQLIKEESLGSDNIIDIKTFKFPSDYKGISATDEISLGVKNLQDMNVLSGAVEQSRWKKNASVEYLISSDLKVYQSDQPVLKNISSSENVTLLTNFIPSYVQGGKFIKDNRYIPKFIVDRYDNKGNILEQHEDKNIHYSYVWSYNKYYPVIEVRNATYSDIENALGVSVIEQFCQSIPSTSTISSIVSTLKSALPNAHISSCTFQPLVGMLSQTDSKGKTTYYEYDGFQRLKFIKDQNGNVVKSYDYHYKQ